MSEQVPASFSPQDALVAVMVAESASDENITNSELMSITRIVDHMPIFAKYDLGRIKTVSQVVFDLFEVEDGLDALFGIVRDALPEELYETAYAMACDVAAADGRLRQGELEFMAEIRYELNIDRLHGAAIERGARARHMKLPTP
ncbi:MAG: tellurite resistance TerB family protein [Rhodobacteraceae bacterium]|nr:tellurite resistance TerB family protein [Paracoccaceae bacterium]